MLIYTEKDSKFGFWQRRLFFKISVFTRALLLSNGRSFQTQILSSLLAKTPNFESFSVYNFLMIFLSIISTLTAYEYTLLEGRDIQNASQELASLRITVFREYPYLYDGTISYEIEYLNQYFVSKDGLLILVKEGNTVIGALTGLPLKETMADCQSFFNQHQIPMEDIYYLGEIVLLKEYRGQGIGSKMYELFEHAVSKKKRYSQIAFCEIVRTPLDEPPEDYFCLDPFWIKRGYCKYPDWISQFSWKELSKDEELYHPMVFWVKTFERSWNEKIN